MAVGVIAEHVKVFKVFFFDRDLQRLVEQLIEISRSCTWRRCSRFSPWTGHLRGGAEHQDFLPGQDPPALRVAEPRNFVWRGSGGAVQRCTTRPRSGRILLPRLQVCSTSFLTTMSHLPPVPGQTGCLDQRRSVAQIEVTVPSVPILEPPVPQVVDQLVEVFKHFDIEVPVQVFDEPKITSTRRELVRGQQLVEQRHGLRWRPMVPERGDGRDLLVHGGHGLHQEGGFTASRHINTGQG